MRGEWVGGMEACTGEKTILGSEKRISRILWPECGPLMGPRDCHCGWRAGNDRVRAEWYPGHVILSEEFEMILRARGNDWRILSSQVTWIDLHFKRNPSGISVENKLVDGREKDKAEAIAVNSEQVWCGWREWGEVLGSPDSIQRMPRRLRRWKRGFPSRSTLKTPSSSLHSPSQPASCENTSSCDNCSRLLQMKKLTLCGVK